jgi:hypothetical protein
MFRLCSGSTDDSPVADVFVAFSWLFGGEGAEAAEAPVSSRFRYFTDAAYARSGKDSGKEMKQVAYVPPCPEWYGDREWNVNLWGTYAFTNTEFAPNPSLIDIVQSTSEGGPVLGTYDRYIGGDHAWGGGGDVKYFFCRYAGVGVEDLHSTPTSLASISSRPVSPDTYQAKNQSHSYDRRCPWHTYVAVSDSVHAFSALCLGGCGAIFGGGERDQLHTQGPPDAFLVNAQTDHFGSRDQSTTQFGAGLEIRFARHIGWTNDLSFGILRPRNNFGMIRSGLNFAF